MTKPWAKPDRRKYFTPTRRQLAEAVSLTQNQTEVPAIDSLYICNEPRFVLCPRVPPRLILYVSAC
jgi:hypothetical protein